MNKLPLPQGVLRHDFAVQLLRHRGRAIIT